MLETLSLKVVSVLICLWPLVVHGAGLFVLTVSHFILGPMAISSPRCRVVCSNCEPFCPRANGH